MNTPEAVGHIAVVTIAGSLVLFLGPVGVLIGLVIMVGWIMATGNSKKNR